jgi:hypothetical protein
MLVVLLWIGLVTRFVFFSLVGVVAIWRGRLQALRRTDLGGAGEFVVLQLSVVHPRWFELDRRLSWPKGGSK